MESGNGFGPYLKPGLYLAPSGAGKSYGASLGRWLDGDEIIAERIGWPKTVIDGKNWWKTKFGDYIHFANTAALVRSFADNPNQIVLINAKVDPDAVALYDREGHFSVQGAFLPTEEWIMRNYATHPHAKQHRDEAEFRQDIEGNRRDIMRQAEHWGVPVLLGTAADDFFARGER